MSGTRNINEEKEVRTAKIGKSTRYQTADDFSIVVYSLDIFVILEPASLHEAMM